MITAKKAAYHKAYYEANKEKIAAQQKAYKEANKEESAAYNKVYREANKEELAAYNKVYREANKEELAAKKKVYYEANKEKKKEYHARPESKARRRERENKRHAESPGLRIHRSVSSQIRKALGKGGKNGRRTFEILGYTVQDLMNHLETQWESWMTWENHGMPHLNGCKSWQIDHIAPVSSFKISSTEDQSFKDCWALSNLQPLEAIENIKKGSRY